MLPPEAEFLVAFSHQVEGSFQVAAWVTERKTKALHIFGSYHGRDEPSVTVGTFIGTSSVRLAQGRVTRRRSYAVHVQQTNRELN